MLAHFKCTSRLHVLQAIELFFVHLDGIGCKQIMQKSVSEGEEEEVVSFFFLAGVAFFFGDFDGLPLFWGDLETRFSSFAFRFSAMIRRLDTCSVDARMALAIDFRPRLLLGFGLWRCNGPIVSTAVLRLASLVVGSEVEASSTAAGSSLNVIKRSFSWSISSPCWTTFSPLISATVKSESVKIPELNGQMPKNWEIEKFRKLERTCSSFSLL